jgi:hypothetical protein
MVIKTLFILSVPQMCYNIIGMYAKEGFDGKNNHDTG